MDKHKGQDWIVCNEMNQKVVEPLSIGYYVKKAFQSLFLIILLMRIMDFATDITLNIQYYHEDFKDFPNATECEIMELKNDSTISCYFNQMSDSGKMSLFWVSCLVFILTWFMECFFILFDKNSKHYRAMAVGHCCWNRLYKDKPNLKIKILRFMIWIVVSLLSQILTAIYGFYIQEFVEYWRPTKKERPVDSKSNKDCSRCGKGIKLYVHCHPAQTARFDLSLIWAT